ncbi:MAG: ParB/RepB/Spo0J family partition protein [Acutalibacteraceae bacterium]
MAKKLGGLGKGLDAIFMENESEKSDTPVTLKISEITPNRNQPRKEFSESAIDELSESIKKYGILQPLLVRPDKKGGYQIVAGERRYRASQKAGITEVPVVIRELSDEDTMTIALIENLQRENLSPMEEALGYKNLIDDYGLTQEQVASAVGKSRSAVANTIRLLNLPQKIQKLVEQGKISPGHARTLLSVEDEKEMLQIADILQKEEMSVRKAEQLVKSNKAKNRKSSSQSTKDIGYVKKPSTYKEVELALSEYLGKKVKVSKKGEGGVLQIEFYSIVELLELANKLEDN